MLREYLSRPDHIDVGALAPVAFAAWLEESVLGYVCGSHAARARARAKALRKHHATTLVPLEKAVAEAETSYAVSTEGAAIENTTHLVGHQRAAKDGLEIFVSSSGGTLDADARKVRRCKLDPSLKALSFKL